MDKFNVLSITTDINELEQDMQQWSLLPYDFRRRSNDSCIRMYGITVPELYARLRNKIQAISDLNRKDDSNLVYENAWEEEDNYQSLLTTSKNLQNNAYVVIIDPDITTKEELVDRMNSFNALSKRLKKISNEYSWQIWGYNVPNMYNMMLNILDTEDNKEEIDNSNIVRLDEASIQPISDYYNHAILTGDILTTTKYENDLDNIIESGDLISKIIASKMKEDNKETLYEYNLILPKYLPWFTGPELQKYVPECKLKDHEDYYLAVTEALYAYNKNRTEESKKSVLELGWNPSLPFNEFTLHGAMIRQLDYITSYNYFDITNFVSESSDNVEVVDKELIQPIFIVQNEDKISLGLNTSLVELYSFENNYDKFNPDKEYLKNSDIFMAFIDTMSFDRLTSVLNDPDSKDTISNICNLDSIYTILMKARNNLDPAKKLVFFASYIENILNLINCTNNSGLLMDYSRLSNKKAIYKVSKAGEEYEEAKTKELIELISNNTKLSKILRYDKAVDKVEAEPIIVANNKE